MPNFFTELTVIAPAAGQGCYAFMDSGGDSRGFVQLISGGPSRVTIHRLWTLRPGAGAGKLMLRELCRLADRHGVDLDLKPLPFGRKPHPLNREQLLMWYRRHGFEGTFRKMVRKSRTWPGAAADLSVPASGDTPSNPVFLSTAP